MASTQLEFSSLEAHRAWLASQSRLPRGFAVARHRFRFTPVEVHKPSEMTMTLIKLDQPSNAVAGMFTRNAFPGAPVILGRRRVQGSIGAVIVNNKVSNVCAPGGVESAQRVCDALGKQLGMMGDLVLPSSTGVIGWQLPVDAMVNAMEPLVAGLSSESVMPAAEGIVTTDLYPKVRRVDLPNGGSIVGIAKGAGMIEPNLATMLVFILTDCDVDREVLQGSLHRAVDQSFNAMSIDSDTSTSDTVVVLSSRAVACGDIEAFHAGLKQVCADLCEDVVRNGEGVHHVMRVTVKGAPDDGFARRVGKSIVNSPLVQCAVCGNDPNVGRLVMAIGKYVGEVAPELDLRRTTLAMGGRTLFADGEFRLDQSAEEFLVGHFRAAELYASVPPPDGLTFRPAVRFPPHERCVEITVDLGVGNGTSVVLGADRTHEYISENADYRT